MGESTWLNDAQRSEAGQSAACFVRSKWSGDGVRYLYHSAVSPRIKF
jgi:hypothetical protein